MLHIIYKSFRSGRLISTSALLVAMILWGSSFVAMKIAFRDLHPMVVIFGRMAVAALCFAPFLPSFTRLPFRRHHILPLLGMGFCEPCLYFLFEAGALMQTSASQAAMITTMLPLLVALCAGFFLHERISRRTAVGFVIAAAGALWLSLAGRSDSSAPNPLLGNFLEFLAMVSATGYIILMKYLSRSLPPFFLTAVQAFVGAFFFLPFFLLPGIDFPSWPLPGGGLLAIFYLGTFVTVGAYGLYNFGVSRVPAHQAAAFINLIPVVTIIMGFFLLGERLSFWQVIACMVVFVGVFVSQDLSRNMGETVS